MKRRNEDRKKLHITFFCCAGSGYGIRHLQILFLFLALSVGFATRVNLSVAIVVMMELPVRSSINVRFLRYITISFQTILGIPMVREDKVLGAEQLLLGLRIPSAACRSFSSSIWWQGYDLDRFSCKLGTDGADAFLCQLRWLEMALWIAIGHGSVSRNPISLGAHGHLGLGDTQGACLDE